MIDLQFSKIKFTLSLALSHSLLLSRTLLLYRTLSCSLARSCHLVLSCTVVSLSPSPPPRGRDDILRPNETSVQPRRTHEA